MDPRDVTRPSPRSRVVGRVVRFQLTAVVLATCATVACQRAQPEALGQYDRVVSLAPSITDLLFAIGAGEQVVGRTRWAAAPDAALAVPSVGDGLNPNVESIAARRPDLVALYTSPSTEAAEAQLRSLGIATVSLRMDRLDDVAPAARELGAYLGVEARADSIASTFAAALDSARRAPVPAQRPRVLILTWDQPPIVIGAGSFQSEILELAGGVNVYADLTTPSGQVTIESIVERDPEFVLLTGGVSDPSWARRPEWQAVPAIRERRFVVVEGTAFAYPSFRALDAVRQLREALRAVGKS